MTRKLLDFEDEINAGQFCDNPEALVKALDSLSKRILKKIDAFKWTITADGKNYADGGCGCAGVSSITNKPNKTCPHDRIHGLTQFNSTIALPKKSGSLKIGQ